MCAAFQRRPPRDRSVHAEARSRELTGGDAARAESLRGVRLLLDIDLCFQGFDRELETLPGEYAPPRGTIIIAFVDGEAAGVVALRPIDGAVCEMKRLFVEPAHRGKAPGGRSPRPSSSGRGRPDTRRSGSTPCGRWPRRMRSTYRSVLRNAPRTVSTPVSAPFSWSLPLR